MPLERTAMARTTWKDVGRAWFMLAAFVTAPFWALVPALRERMLSCTESIAEEEKHRAGGAQ